MEECRRSGFEYRPPPDGETDEQTARHRKNVLNRCRRRAAAQRAAETMQAARREDTLPVDVEVTPADGSRRDAVQDPRRTSSHQADRCQDELEQARTRAEAACAHEVERDVAAAAAAAPEPLRVPDDVADEVRTALHPSPPG